MSKYCEACGQELPDEPVAGVVTVEGIDDLSESLTQMFGVDADKWVAMLRALRPLAVLAERSPVPLAELVEEAEYKHRIVEAGCYWGLSSAPVRKDTPWSAWDPSDGNATVYRKTGKEAAEWAEATAAESAVLRCENADPETMVLVAIRTARENRLGGMTDDEQVQGAVVGAVGAFRKLGMVDAEQALTLGWKALLKLSAGDLTGLAALADDYPGVTPIAPAKLWRMVLAEEEAPAT